MDSTSLGRVLFIGGTGMLADATRYISERSNSLVLGARNPAPLAQETGATALTLDWHDRVSAHSALDDMAEFDLAVSWLHDDGVWLAEHVEAKVKTCGRSIRVHGSDSKDPSVMAKRDPNPRSDISRQTVILGWHKTTSGRRWLSDGDICQGVVEAAENEGRRVIVVGTLDE